MDIYEYGEKEGKEKCWEDTEPIVRELGKLLKAKGGPFIEGDTREFKIEILDLQKETS